MDEDKDVGLNDEASGDASSNTTVVTAGTDVDPHDPGRTVLPSPLAKAVSLATRSTSLVIRIGTIVGSAGFDFARFTTLSSLELGQGILEGVLSTAGKDVIARSRGELSRADAETVLERSLETIHYAMTQVVFVTTTGFHITGSALAMASDTSQYLLSFLDQLFGSTDSSRAIASIITLIRREFQNPATGANGERVGTTHLLLGLCSLVYLQQRSRKLIDEESRTLGIEEPVWDVVVLNDGERVDIHEESLYGVHAGRYGALTPRPRSRRGSRSSGKFLEYDTQTGHASSEDDEELPEIRLKRQIMRSLPPDASVSISTSVSTTKTITVDFSAPQPLLLSPPPGVEVVEERQIVHPVQPSRPQSKGEASAPTYRVVYKVDRNQLRTTTFKHAVGDGSPVEEGGNTRHAKTLPPVPPKPRNSGIRPSSSQVGVQATRALSTTGSTSLRPTSGTHGRQVPESSRPTPRHEGARSPLAARPHADVPRHISKDGKALPKKPKQDSVSSAKAGEKKGGLRQVFKIGTSPSISNLWKSESSNSQSRSSVSEKSKPPTLPAKNPATRPSPQSNLPIATRHTLATKSARRTANDLEGLALPPRSSSRSSYIAVHDQRRDSLVSQTDMFSIHSADGSSPTRLRTGVASKTSITKSRSGKDMTEQLLPPVARHHRRAKSLHSPSFYSLASGGSQTSLVLSSYYDPGRSAYADGEALQTLRRTGMVDGIFPRFHLLRNVRRYMLYSSAAYGFKFLKFMGIRAAMPIPDGAPEHPNTEIRSFARHTGSHPDDVLLASFVDPQGGTDSTGSTGTGVPLIHYISLDHVSKAVVLACRGTLGFDDVLADMTCDYDDLSWRGESYQVHKGIHASARRLLFGGDGKVMYMLREALEEFSDYGLVLCGHSLGGAVTALLGVMLSEPGYGTNFVTSTVPHTRLLTDGTDIDASSPRVPLPSGRPIHVYAYGAPGTMCSSLRTATRGLVTTIVQGNDIVPSLSLGVLHDLQAVALAVQTDDSGAKLEVRQRVWQAFRAGLADSWYNNNPLRPGGDDEEQWAFAALKTLRSSMVGKKLLPPGEVFVVETGRVLRRDAFLLAGEEDLGRPARRIVFKYIRDVEARFGEVRFGTSMLADHSPARYEEALSKLQIGVVG